MAWKFDKDAYQQQREDADQGGGSDFFTFEEGDTVIYVCEPCRPDDDFNFIEVKQHDNGFGNGINHICLNPAKNKVIEHPAFVEALAARNEGEGLDISDGCPTCQRLAAGQLKDAGKVKLKGRYFWNIVPMKFRSEPRSPFKTLEMQVRPCPARYTLWDGFMDQYANEGNISDPEAAILLKVTREGQKMDTEYTVGLDTETVRKPMQLPQEMRDAISEALQPGASGDLYRIIASLVKSPAEIVDQLEGKKDEKKDDRKDKGKVATAPTGGAKAASSPPKGATSTGASKGSAAAAIGKKKPAGAPACYAVDCTPNDPQCQACPVKEGCATACGVDVPPAPTSQKAFVKPEKAPPKPPVRINASEAEEGEEYKLQSGDVMKFTGTAKGKFFFENDDGERKGLAGDALVEPLKKAAPAAAAKEEPAAEEEAPLTVGTATAGAWYKLPGHDDALQFKGTTTVKGVKKGMFESAELDRFNVELTLKLEGPVDAPSDVPADEEADKAEAEPPMPAAAEDEGGDDVAMAELEKQLANRKKKAK